MENKEKIRSLAENVWAYIAAFLRWGILGLLVGGLGGFVGALFAKSVAWATAMRGANPWLLYLLPVGGLAIVGVYKLCRVSGVGTNEVFEGAGHCPRHNDYTPARRLRRPRGRGAPNRRKRGDVLRQAVPFK